MNKIKFSIIIPVYNIEKYITKCLDSVINQTYKNYEVIIVCDDSKDKSNIIVDSYVKNDKRFIKCFEKNTGLAKAKNIGLSKATGDYILFLDGDDYIEKDLLQKLVDEDIDKYDLLRFQAREVKNNDVINEYSEEQFISKNGIEAFKKIINYHYIENSWLYSYSNKFFKENNFSFNEGCVAEDYGLTPLIIASANKVKCISYIGYNYVQRDNSLMNSDDYNNKIKKMDDMLKQATYQKLELDNIKNSEIVKDFLDDSLIYFSTRLKYKDYRKYNKILKKRNCFKHLKGTSFRNKIRCFLIKFNSFFFFRYIKR